MKLSILLSSFLISGLAIAENGFDLSHQVGRISMVPPLQLDCVQPPTLPSARVETLASMVEDTATKQEEQKANEEEDKITTFFEVIIPVQRRQGTNSKARVSIPPINITSAFSSADKKPHEYTDAQLVQHLTEYEQRLGNRMISAERIQDAIIAIRAAEKAETEGLEETMSYITRQLKHASVARKFSFFSTFLKRMNDNYDENLPDGDVSELKIFSEMQKEFNGESAISRTVDVAGTCRHMHMLALQTAKGLGFKMAYLLHYPTSSGYHVNMVISNPNNPSQTIQVNYSRMRQVNGAEGAAAISQQNSNPNSGVGYHVFDHTGKSAYYTMNEKGLVLNRMTGGHDGEFDPHLESESRIIKAGAKLGNHHIQMFYALNPEYKNGEHITGVSFHTKVPYNRFVKSEYGVAAYHSERQTNEVFDPFWQATAKNLTHLNPTSTLSTTGLFFRMRHGAVWRIVGGLELDVALGGRGTVYSSTVESSTPAGENGEEGTTFYQQERATLADFSGSFYGALRYRYNQDASTALSIDASAAFRDITAKTGLAFYARRLELTHDQRFRMGNFNFNSESRLSYIPLDGDVNPVIFGQVISMEHQEAKNQLLIKAVVPLNPQETPWFIGGARRTFSLQYGHRLGKHVMISLGGSYAPSMTYQSTDAQDADEISYVPQASGAEAEEPAAQAPVYAPQIGTRPPGIGVQPGSGFEQVPPSVAPGGLRALKPTGIPTESVIDSTPTSQSLTIPSNWGVMLKLKVQF